MSYADLHLHSTYSDGADAPATVIARAAALGIAAAALTDHDTVDGAGEFVEAGRAAGIETLPGVEISAFYEGREVHVVGLGVDTGNPALNAVLAQLRAGRLDRVRHIVERLRDVGIPLWAEDVLALSPTGAAGRIHIANALKAAGVVANTQEAFDRYLNIGKPAYVRKWLIPVPEAIDAIHGAGGLAFLAHPGLGKTVRRMLPRLLAFPFDGIEVYHVSHGEERTATFLALAKERGLLVAGGSDCHGTVKGRRPEMGRVRLPYEAFAAIKAALPACH